MKLLSAIQLKEKKKERKGSMYVKTEVNGTELKGLVDTRASDLFVSIEAAKKLGLKVVEIGAQMKSVNSPPILVEGIARGVHLKIGTWSGTEDLIVAEMDDY